MQDLQGVKPYRTVQRDAEAEQIVQKSRFIGRCFAVADEAEAAERLAGIRKQYWDATHHCYAFCIGANVPNTRSSDDGEPSGTAGAPILNVLSRMELTNVLCVVTRYFGGVLLGAGGLVRAYSNAASAAVAAAGTVWMRPANGYVCSLTYPQWAVLESALRKAAEVTDVSYTDCVTVTFFVDCAECEETLKRLIDLSDGRIAPKFSQTRMRPGT